MNPSIRRRQDKILIAYEVSLATYWSIVFDRFRYLMILSYLGIGLLATFATKLHTAEEISVWFVALALFTANIFVLFYFNSLNARYFSLKMGVDAEKQEINKLVSCIRKIAIVAMALLVLGGFAAIICVSAIAVRHFDANCCNNLAPVL